MIGINIHPDLRKDGFVTVHYAIAIQIEEHNAG